MSKSQTERERATRGELPDDVQVTIVTGGGKGGDDRNYHFDHDCRTLRAAGGKRRLPPGVLPIRGSACQVCRPGWYDGE